MTRSSITRRQLLTGIVAMSAVGVTRRVALSDYHIRHEREYYAPLCWVCVGWLPSGTPGRIYIVVARYTSEDLERFGSEHIRARVESYVKARLNRMDPSDLYAVYDAVRVHLPYRDRDFSPDWDRGGPA